MKKTALALLSIFLLIGCTSPAKPSSSSPVGTSQEEYVDSGNAEKKKVQTDNSLEPLEFPTKRDDSQEVLEGDHSPNKPLSAKKETKEKDENKTISTPPSASEPKPIKPVPKAPKPSSPSTQPTSPKPVQKPVPKLAPSPEPTPKPVAKEKWQIPSFVGTSRTSSDAQLNSLNSKMQNLGFTPLDVTYTEQENSSVAKGLVISQSISPGTYDNISKISLIISKGAPAPVFSGKDLPNHYPRDFQSNLENEVFTLVNQHRANNGLSPLVWSNSLHESSRHKSNSMVQYDYFSHSNPHLNGEGSSHLLWTLYSVPFNRIGENIASRTGYSQVSAADIFTQWKNSAGHNKNMLSPDFTHIGVGIVYSSKPGPNFSQAKSFISTQHFGGN